MPGGRPRTPAPTKSGWSSRGEVRGTLPRPLAGGHDPGVTTVGGLPAHPLLVHAVVVLLPLAALGALVLSVRPSWSRPYGPLVAAAALGGAVAATLAKFAGDQLAAAIEITPGFQPVIDEHGRLGLYAVVAAWPFALLTVLAAVLGRRPRPAGRIAGMLAALSGVAAVVTTVVAGHSGSAAVWGSVLE